MDPGSPDGLCARPRHPTLAGVAAAARVAAGRGRRRARPRRRIVPRVGHPRRRKDHVRPPRRPPDAHRGPGRTRRGDRPDDAHLPPVGGRRRALRDRPRAQPAQLGRPRAARPSRRRGDVRDARRRPRRAPPPLRRAADAPDRRRAPPHGRAGGVGPQHPRRVRTRPVPAAAVRHAVPLGQHADPVGDLRRRRRVQRGLRLRLHGGADRRRVPARDVPHLRRRHGVGVRRAPPEGRLHGRPPRRRGGAAAAHRPGPRRRLGRARAGRRAPRADRPARRHPPGRRRARGGG